MKHLSVLIALCVLAGFSVACLADVSDRYAGTIYYVSQQRGDDANSGLSWSQAKETLDQALEQIEDDDVQTAQIWVSAETPTSTGTADTYDSPTADVDDGISIFGGFDGTENNRWQRNWRRNVTTLEGQVTIGSGALDGFTITHPDGTGVVMSSADGAAFGLLSHNIIKSVSVGVRCGPCASPVITNNVITQFSTTGIWAEQGLPCHIANNTIVHTGVKTGTAGIKLAASYSGGCECTGVVVCANIIVGCETGVYGPSQFVLDSRNNNLYDNTTPGLYGWGHIYTDPLFVNLSQGDFRISETSPCIDKDGGNSYMEQLDIDCNPRMIDVVDVGNDGEGQPVYDIGAYEYQAPPLIDRGLPPLGKINSSAGADRANIRWADPNPNVFYGDTFLLPSGKNWIVDTVRVWAIPSVPGYPNYCLGDHFSGITLYTKDPSGSVLDKQSCSLTPGNSHGNFDVRITPTVYANDEGYERTDGGSDKIWQIDITNLAWAVTGGQTYYFGVYGTPRVDRLWFNSASNATLSGWSGNGTVYRFDVTDLLAGSASVDFTTPLAAWMGRESNSSVRRSDVNVQVFGHPQ